MIEDTKKWVLSPERKAPEATREYTAKHLDGVLDKFLKTHADHFCPFAGSPAKAGSPAERQGADQGKSTGFCSATAKPLAGRADAQTHRTASNEERVFGDLTPHRVRSGAGLAISCLITDTRLQGSGGASERSLRLRSNEVLSGDFKQRNGLASARWRD